MMKGDDSDDELFSLNSLGREKKLLDDNEQLMKVFLSHFFK